MSCAELDSPFAPLRHPEHSHDHDAIDAIRQALQGLRYGQIVVVVQDGVVVQVDRTERRRLRVNGTA